MPTGPRSAPGFHGLRGSGVDRPCRNCLSSKQARPHPQLKAVGPRLFDPLVVDGPQLSQNCDREAVAFRGRFSIVGSVCRCRCTRPTKNTPSGRIAGVENFVILRPVSVAPPSRPIDDEMGVTRRSARDCKAGPRPASYEARQTQPRRIEAIRPVSRSSSVTARPPAWQRARPNHPGGLTFGHRGTQVDPLKTEPAEQLVEPCTEPA